MSPGLSVLRAIGGLWVGTAAAGRTSCVLKGRECALFGTGRDGKVN